MTDLAASFLATLAASYVSPEVDESNQRAIVAATLAAATATAKGKPAMRKLRASKAEASPSTPRAMARLAFPVEPIGTLNAAQFMIAIRDAGRRYTDAGIPFTLEPEIRNDKIRAIAAYCGYDAIGARAYDDSGKAEGDDGASHGAQELRAIMQATRELSPVVQVPCHVKVVTSSFVAGLPNFAARRLQDLKARERLATDRICEARKVAKEGGTLSLESADRFVDVEFSALTEGEFQLLDLALDRSADECFAMLANVRALTVAQVIKLEQDRLAQIQADLDLEF